MFISSLHGRCGENSRPHRHGGRPRGVPRTGVAGWSSARALRATGVITSVSSPPPDPHQTSRSGHVSGPYARAMQGGSSARALRVTRGVAPHERCGASSARALRVTRAHALCTSDAGIPICPSMHVSGPSARAMLGGSSARALRVARGVAPHERCGASSARALRVTRAHDLCTSVAAISERAFQ